MAGRAVEPLLQSKWLPHSDYSPTPAFWATLSVCLIAIATRFITTRRANVSRRQHDVSMPPAVPYWLPILGHIPNVLYDCTTFFRRTRDKYGRGLFTLNIAGSRHHIVYSPDLVTALLDKQPGGPNNKTLTLRNMINAFGLPRDEAGLYQIALPELDACYSELSSNDGLVKLSQGMERRLKENTKNLVTGSESPVDMMPWEKAANSHPAKDEAGRTVQEADYSPLLRDFIDHMSLPLIMGSDFLENNPDFPTSLWDFDKACFWLKLGLPRWLPMPAVTRAHIARKRMLAQLCDFHKVMELEARGEYPGSKWTDLDNISELIKTRTAVYRKHGFSIEARAASDLYLIWAASVNSNELTRRMLYRISNDKALLELIREEIAPHIEVIQPKQTLAFAEPPRLKKIDVEELRQRCSTLKSCYIECLRLDVDSWSSRIANDDIELQRLTKDDLKWLIRQGDYCHAVCSLHNTDPTAFDDALAFNPTRYNDSSLNLDREMDVKGLMQTYDSGFGVCRGQEFASKQVFMIVGAIVAMWDIQPSKSSQQHSMVDWSVKAWSNHTAGARVWLRYRPIPTTDT